MRSAKARAERPRTPWKERESSPTISNRCADNWATVTNPVISNNRVIRPTRVSGRAAIEISKVKINLGKASDKINRVARVMINGLLKTKIKMDEGKIRIKDDKAGKADHKTDGDRRSEEKKSELQ